MKDSTKLHNQGYSGVKVTSMLNALQSKEIHDHLRLVQQDELSKIKNFYKKNKYITKPQMNLVWNCYWNFVLNDFRFDDKSKTYTIVSEIKNAEPQHIGLVKLKKELEKED